MKTLSLNINQALKMRRETRELISRLFNEKRDMDTLFIRWKDVSRLKPQELLSLYVSISAMYKEMVTLLEDDNGKLSLADQAYIYTILAMPDDRTISDALDSLLVRIQLDAKILQLGLESDKLSEYLDTFPKEAFKKIKNKKKLEELEMMGLI